MQKALRILHLEDDPDYPELVRSLLEADGLAAEIVPVVNRPEFEAALEGEPFDLILADYSLGEDYNGVQALRKALETWPETPVLVVSGTIGEQAAIESLKSGATDYVLKQWPERLAPAVRRAAQEAQERRRRREAELGLRESEEQNRLIVAAQKRLEDQLRQAQKMEAIGHLAGGVAHDFNNILTVIRGHAELLLTEASLSERALHSARQIGQAAERGSALTRQLLAFSRRQVMQPRLLDLNDVVRNLTKMLSRIVGENIQVQAYYSPKLAPVRGDAGMVEQVLLNLVVNARDAMPQGGRAVIKVMTVEVDAAHVERHPEGRSGRFICLSVTDSGCGIGPDQIRHLFEPFYTTKEVGKGTGLGLATVYGIVTQHLGWVEVESELGKGSTFSVFLPWAAGAQPEPAPAVGPRALPRGGNETILVVEDEGPLRDLVRRYLARWGYRVLDAENGAKALELWAGHREEIAMVVTDLIMPDSLNGRQLAERVQGERPQVRFVFISGYSKEALGQDFGLRPGFNYLQKPFQPRDLAIMVRARLDGP